MKTDRQTHARMAPSGAFIVGSILEDGSVSGLAMPRANFPCEVPAGLAYRTLSTETRGDIVAKAAGLCVPVGKPGVKAQRGHAPLLKPVARFHESMPTRSKVVSKVFGLDVPR